ncbi:unnamed protein product [Closterium sp. Yama58-4]|nr:unnamed protein product [Closterium sp. Yama58-4]
MTTIGSQRYTSYDHTANIVIRGLLSGSFKADANLDNARTDDATKVHAILKEVSWHIEAINALSVKTSALKINDLPGEETSKKSSVDVTSGDPEAVSAIASQAGFAITLLIPHKWIEEVSHMSDTVRGLLLLWEEHLTENAKSTAKCHKLTPTWLSKERFGRVQVVFVHAADANFMWSRKVEHVTLSNVRLILGWQHPENQEYLKERSMKPDAIEVLLRNVPAVITPEMIWKSLVTATLLKRKRSAFLEGSAFHRVVDPITGSDTDKIKGLVYRHPGDKYKWWHRVTDKIHGTDLLVSFPALTCSFCNGMHMSCFHDEYVTERQDNIIKWNVPLARVHEMNGNHTCSSCAFQVEAAGGFAHLCTISPPSSSLSEADCSYKGHYGGPGDGLHLDQRRTGGVAVRSGGMRESTRRQLRKGSRARGLCDALYRTSQGGIGDASKQGEDEPPGGQEGLRDVSPRREGPNSELRPTTCATASAEKGAGGVAIVAFRKHIQFTEVMAHHTGRLLGVTVEGGDTKFRLIAAYLPAQPGKRTKFHAEHLVPFAQAQPAGAHLVLVGDLNIIADPDLDRSSNTGSSRENQRLLEAWSTFDLRDAFRELNPRERQYTFRARPSDTRSRIDRALVSTSFLGELLEASHKWVPKKLSDHQFAIRVSLAFTSSHTSGPGIWRLQATRVNRRGIRAVIQKIMGIPDGRSGRALEQILPRLSAALRTHGREEQKRVAATRRHLEAEITRLNHLVMAGPTEAAVKERLLTMEAQLEGYQESERERLQVLARLDLEMHGEIPSPYLSAKVKMRKDKTIIKEVMHKGKRFYGSQEVLKAAADHFQEAFKKHTEAEVGKGDAVEVSRRLLEEAAERLCAQWSEAEIKEALVGLPRGKSPGHDGLPPELFKAHWDLLGGPLVEFARRFEKTGLLDESITTAVTVLLHKKGPLDQLGNYRPITLLSTIYKVLAKLLANRLKKELHQIVSEDQHGFIPGRCLADAVAVVTDAVDAAGNGGDDWFLLMVDIQKAYDTVARPYLFETMGKLGIPDEFIRWTEGLHHGSGTRVAINGWLGERVEMQRGVRQGCPLAPYLFLCALEPLCCKIKEKGLGVSAEGAEVLSYVGYADDATLILKGVEQLKEAEKILEQFGELSGLKTNKDKSVVMPLGRNKGKRDAQGVYFKWAEDGVPERLLGIWITPEGDPGRSWEKAWERGKAELVKWESHHLLTAARVTVINAYIMPIFIFQAQIYPPPEELWKRIRKTCDNYVSSGQATSEKLFVLWCGELARLPKKDGGLGLVDPKARIDSMAIRMVGKLVLEQNATKRWLAEKAAALSQGAATLLADPSALKHWHGGSKCWKAAVEAFWESPYAELSEPKTGWEVEQEKVCVNCKVMFRGKRTYGNQQGTEGIRQISFGDLVEVGSRGERTVKSKESLRLELGGVAAARWALMAYAAISKE